MLSINHVLVPVDFSERSIVSARYARLLACHFHSEVTLLHVLEPPPYMLGPIEFGGIVESEVRKIREDSAEKQIQELAAHEFGSMPVRTLVHAGDAARNIVELAHSEEIGLTHQPGA
jgi:nucleotide-binding universal stress UspA family protein